MRVMNNRVNTEKSPGGLASGHATCDNADMNIESLRRLRGLNQQQLAEMTGTSQTLISRAEKGDPGLTLGKLQAIAQALNVPLAELFEDRSATEAELLAIFRRLPRDRQAVWLELSRTFSQDRAPRSPGTPGDPRQT